MNVLWLVSSVGLGHLTRSQCIIRHLQKKRKINIDFLVPSPITEYADKSLNILKESNLIKGSGSAYFKIFSEITDQKYDLYNFLREDNKYNANNYLITMELIKKKKYIAIIGDESFWILSNNGMLKMKEQVPIIFITDFLGMKSMDPTSSVKNKYFEMKNKQFVLTAPKIAKKIIFVGNKNDIPDTPFGSGLINQRLWAEKYCKFIKPIVNLNTNMCNSKTDLKNELNIPLNKKIYLAIIPKIAESCGMLQLIENAFSIIKNKDLNTYFIISSFSGKGTEEFIHYKAYLPNLSEYMFISDFIVCQTGLMKITELSALKKPFISFPLDYHFEQEYLLDIRIKNYGFGKQLLLRETNAEKLVQEIDEVLNKYDEEKKFKYDTGISGANTINQILDEIILSQDKN